jgi:hypothetical protein
MTIFKNLDFLLSDSADRRVMMAEMICIWLMDHVSKAAWRIREFPDPDNLPLLEKFKAIQHANQ